MGLIDRLADRLRARRTVAEGEDALVTVANVRAFQAPMIEEVLAQGGVGCSVIDEHAASTWEPMRRIQVRRSDAAAAEKLLADFHAR